MTIIEFRRKYGTHTPRLMIERLINEHVVYEAGSGGLPKLIKEVQIMAQELEQALVSTVPQEVP